MALAPATWSKLVEHERTKIIIEPFVGFFDVGGLASNENRADIDDVLDAEAALIPRMILILRKLDRIREAASRRAPFPHRSKVGPQRSVPRAPAAQERNINVVALAPDPRQKPTRGV